MRMNEILSVSWFLSPWECALLDLPAPSEPQLWPSGWGLALLPGPGPRPEAQPECVSSGRILRVEQHKPGYK